MTNEDDNRALNMTNKIYILSNNLKILRQLFYCLMLTERRNEIIE